MKRFRGRRVGDTEIGKPRSATVILLLAGLVASLALALPASADAGAGYFVETTVDAPKSVPGDECETAAGVCTFRAAIEAANVTPNKDGDRIAFELTPQGGVIPTVVVDSPLPPLTEPVRIDATPCERGQGPPFPCVPVSFPAGSPGIEVMAGGSAVEGLIMSGAEPAILVSGAAAGNKIEGNKILTPPLSADATGVLIENGPNDVFANLIEGTCCSSGIVLEGDAEGNRIGGETAQSENVIDGFGKGAISMTLPEGSRNEVGRNRGLGGGDFIGLFKANVAEAGLPNQVEPPVIGGAYQSGATGSAEPGARIRVFRKAGTDPGELEGFLGAATADGAGKWKASFPTIPLGTVMTATQTRSGGTSQLAATASAAVDPPPPPPDGGGGSGGGGSGGSGGGSGGGTGQPSGPEVVVDHFPPPVTPRAQITAGPKGGSDSSTARFRFTSSVAGSGFECRLDAGEFFPCRPPRTYRHLKPGRHVFRVRAVGAGGVVGAAAKRTFRVSG
jgi:hypothetical protein